MPALTSLAIGAVVAGTAISAYGQYKANQAQASADEANAAFYKEQAAFAQDAGDRELAVFEGQADQILGAQKSGVARGGVEIAGSPLLVFGDTQVKRMRQEQAIKEETHQKVFEASTRGTFSQSQADNLNSFASQALPLAGTLLTGFSQAAVVGVGGGRGTIRSAGSSGLGGSIA